MPKVELELKAKMPKVEVEMPKVEVEVDASINVPAVPVAAVKFKRRGSVCSDKGSVMSMSMASTSGKFMLRDRSRQIKESIRNDLQPEMQDLHKVLRSHQRRQDTNRDAHMRNFYREKYKGRYMFAMLN